VSQYTSQEGWRKALLPQSSIIEDAIKVLNDCGLRIVMVVDDYFQLVGTISDGDIRRGLLRGLTLNSPTEQVVNKESITVSPGMERELVVDLMKVNKIQQIPIIDNSKKVIGLHLLDEIDSVDLKENKFVIMAGGKGSRLHPQTKNCPKPMLHVAGRPILEHIIKRASLEGFCDFLIAVNYLGEMIEDYFGDGSNFGVNIAYLKENSPMGTAGALSLIDPLPTEAFVVSNGDVITDIKYAELLDFHLKHKAHGSMAIRPDEWQNPFGVVEIEGIRIVGYEEKPITRSYSNAGVYVIDPSKLSLLRKNQFYNMPDLFNLIQESNGLTIAYPIHEKWIDVGRPNDLLQAQRDIK
jgi:dTDP-glucose pyrophosphorylase